MHLTQIGWTPTLQLAFERLQADDPSLAPARVARQDARSYRVLDAHGDERDARLAPGRALRDDPPVVGDFVAWRPSDGAIVATLPRRTFLARVAAGRAGGEQPLAANVVVAFLVMALDADFSPRRLERYLVIARAGGVHPVVVLNKADACADPAMLARDAQAAAPGVDVIVASAATGAGLDEVARRLPPGVTGVFLGSSGVGKSTLVNALLGEDRMATGAVREADAKGRHTTTHRQLLLVPGGGVVLDTPGMRELRIGADEAAVRDAFSEIADLALGCRFRDCRHETEPGCAVRDAVEPARLASFRKLEREAAHAARRASEAGRRAERERARKFGRQTRHVMEDKRRAREW